MQAVPGNRRRLLVLGAGAPQLGLLEAAKRRGLSVVAVDRDPAAPGFRLVERRALIAADDEPAVHRLAEAERIDGVISPANDWSVPIAARVAHRLGLPHPLPPETAALAASPLKQHERFAEAGVPHSAWVGEEAETTVYGFSVGGELHVLAGGGVAADVARAAVAALGIGEGPTCTRLRRGARGPEVVEVAARVGSRAEAEHCLLTSGVDVNALALRSALGEPLEPDLPIRRRIAA
jgi:biotin carboxylase